MDVRTRIDETAVIASTGYFLDGVSKKPARAHHAIIRRKTRYHRRKGQEADATARNRQQARPFAARTEGVPTRECLRGARACGELPNDQAGLCGAALWRVV